MTRPGAGCATCRTDEHAGRVARALDSGLASGRRKPVVVGSGGNTRNVVRLLASGLVLIALVAGCAGLGGVAPPAPTPAPTVAPTGLPAGDYTSAAFVPPITLTLPDGWRITGDTARYFAVQPATSDLAGIHVFRSPSAASQDLDCPTTPAPGVGTTARDLVEWIRARPGLVVGDPASVIVGGFAGLEIDVGIVAGWTPSCPFANGVPTVPLFVDEAEPGFRWVVSGSERLRLSVLDVPGQGTVVVDIDAFDGSLMDDLLVAATPIVRSIKFGLP
jgi:hypothetical protein